MKLLITILATIVLLVHMQPISYMAGVAAETQLSGADLRGLQIQLVVDVGAALLALLVTTVLSVYKPRGVTLKPGDKIRFTIDTAKRVITKVEKLKNSSEQIKTFT